AGSNSDQPACLDVSRRHHEGRAGGRAYAQGYPTPNDRLQCDRALNAKPELNDIQACPLLADFVAKLFFASERATLIQDRASTCNIDSGLEPGTSRREWDSHPRYACPYTRFPSVRLQPLGHPS